MGGSSSKPKKTPVPEISPIDRAVLDLKNARDRLHRYRKKLEQDEEKLVAQAKKAKEAGKKEKAIGLLRLRKYKQAQASSCESQLLNVLQLVETIDSKQNEAEVLSALAAGKDTLKKMHAETTVDDVLNLMDEVREEIEVEHEINAILNEVPNLSPEDEDAVAAELEALQQEMEGTTTTIPNLPVAPDTKLPTIKLPEEKVPQKEARVAVLG
jgi:charged multivesicular body protein 6